MSRIPSTQKIINKVSTGIKVIFSRRYPVYVFHHIPKCGGQSMLQVLSNWFILVTDYRSGLVYKKPVDLHKLRSVHCLCGHFELEGNHICDRYPQIFSTDKIMAFTFLRDPLQAKLSLYRHEKERRGKNVSLEEHLFTRNNYLASIFPVTFDNYQDVLDKYFFVGVLEDAQAGMDLLASLLKKPRQTLPWVNKTNKSTQADISNLPSHYIEKFRQQNQLDYALYRYAQEKYKKRIAG